MLVGVVTGFSAEKPPPEPRQPADKSGFTLFNPTPRELMREMSTDRPDLTESPYTVDAGHFQIEADLINYSYDRHNVARDHTRGESIEIAPFNVRIGLCNSTEFDVIIPTYTWARTRDKATRRVSYDRGFGDLVTRMKINFWGNDGGRTAFGVIPFVKWPTSSGNLGSGSVEGGIILPLAVALPLGVDMGVMTEADFNCDTVGRGHHTEFVNTITFGHQIVGNLNGYVEFATVVSTERGSKWAGTLDFGLTYGITENIQLDAGVNIGVTRSADDINPFLGISFRF
jgi:hypothetical protein